MKDSRPERWHDRAAGILHRPARWGIELRSGESGEREKQTE